MIKPLIAIHGGAGTILKSSMTKEKEALYVHGLRSALLAGFAILDKGGSSVDAVEAAVVVLEDYPLFNAGKGSVFTNDKKHEMDASIMDGSNLMAGAVCGISNVRNPVKLARTVMEHSDHVMLSGKGAEEFARSMNISFENDEYFFTQNRYDQLLNAIEEDRVQLDHTEKKFGTVGAVALDISGNLAAATSTGGMTNKRFNRIGDSPLIGAGTYAKNSTCAVSCTGHGEFFIRTVVAYDISCLMEYKGLSLSEACDVLVFDKLKKIGGEGGLIAVDSKGNVTLPFNSDGMYRGHMSAAGEFVGIYK
jgi:beta-aspartyl-peptidase (threonine type)